MCCMYNCMYFYDLFFVVGSFVVLEFSTPLCLFPSVNITGLICADIYRTSRKSGCWGYSAQLGWWRTCFCLSGPQSCILGYVGGCQMQGLSGRHSHTTGTALEHLPMSPAGFHPSPGSQEETKCIQEQYQYQTAAVRSTNLTYVIWDQCFLFCTKTEDMLRTWSGPKFCSFSTLNDYVTLSCETNSPVDCQLLYSILRQQGRWGPSAAYLNIHNFL